jgi:hypothetical protein
MPRSRSMPLERRALCPVLEDQQGPIEDARRVGRHAQRVLRVVVARRGIGVGTDAQAERRQKIDEALLRKVLRAFELHVLDKMRQPLLVVVLEHRPGPDHQPQLGTAGGLAVRADVIAEAVRQRADRHLGIHRHQPRQGIGGDRRGGRFAPGARRLGRYDKPGDKHAGD